MITVQVNKQSRYNRTYPKLMIHHADLDKEDPLIVLFDKHGSGYAIALNTSQPSSMFGTHTAVWGMRVFEDYTGVLTLKNK